MSSLALADKRLPAMSKMALDKVYQLEAIATEQPQIKIPTDHIIHGGMYARTIKIPAGVMLTGALIKIATILIACGEAVVYIGDRAIPINGYNVLSASAGRKQAFVAKSDLWLTMIFPTDRESIIQAEEQFTDEAHLLFSRKEDAENSILVTGE